MAGPRYRLVLEALPSEIPEAVRLRSALKTLLRAFGLRCLSHEELPEDAPPPHHGGAGRAIGGPANGTAHPGGRAKRPCLMRRRTAGRPA
jgi:hypothetical protein